jgi:hypothetical protein
MPFDGLTIVKDLGQSDEVDSFILKGESDSSISENERDSLIYESEFD